MAWVNTLDSITAGTKSANSAGIFSAISSAMSSLTMELNSKEGIPMSLTFTIVPENSRTSLFCINTITSDALRSGRSTALACSGTAIAPRAITAGTATDGIHRFEMRISNLLESW